MAEMIPVQSSNLAAVGYDEEARELLVQFRSGKTYAYAGADKVLLDDLLAANSAGEYFMRNVKNVYPARQV